MADHELTTTDLYSPDSNHEEFLFREFNKDYEQQHVNNLWQMNREKLMTEYLIVSSKNEALERKIDMFAEEEEKMGEMRKEFLELKEQNRKLMRSNSTMKERIRKM